MVCLAIASRRCGSPSFKQCLMKKENTDRGFQVRSLESAETQSFLRSILRQDTCVPFLGAGFTRGEKARSAAVPGGNEWMEIMRSQISEAHTPHKPSESELIAADFQELSDIYFRDDIVPLEVIKATVNSKFTNVDIKDASKKRFLSISWPYIYTLNIDDAIERVIEGVRVLPYKAFARHPGSRYVYKLHGDAEDVLTAANREDLGVIFGRADYIKSLEKNQYFISNLITDFSEKNILFIGCSLTNEIDISFALASISPSEKTAKTARVFVTSTAPSSYSENRKLQSYGITDVIVGDYFEFYNLAASLSEQTEPAADALQDFKYEDNTQGFSNEAFVSYLLQSGWKHGANPYPVSIPRAAEKAVADKLGAPVVAIYGRRFSGKTTLLHRTLSETRTRRRFLVPSHVSLNLRAFNEIFRIQDALIAIDSGAVHHEQLRTLSRSTDRLAENNTTVLLGLSRLELNALGNGYAEDAINLDAKFLYSEVPAINRLLDPMGFRHWRQTESILDNVFTLGSSPIATGILKNQSRLDQRIDTICSEGRGVGHLLKPSKFDFSLLYYLTVRKRIYSFVHRTLLKKYGLAYIADTHTTEFARKWSPFIEFEETDAVSRKAENSASVLICNSYAWTQLAVRRLSDQLGLAETAAFIVDLYISVQEVDSESFQLILFDNLNLVYSTKRSNEKDWGAGVITMVYEKLAPYCAQNPDYWLQRAKGTYYLSNDPAKIRVAIEYCEKGIVERTAKTGINAKLTKANLLGKLCDVTDFKDDTDLSRAIDAYTDAIENRNQNAAYIDELLRKNRQEIGYMSKVCEAAKSRVGLLPKMYEIRAIEEYANR